MPNQLNFYEPFGPCINIRFHLLQDASKIDYIHLEAGVAGSGAFCNIVSPGENASANLECAIEKWFIEYMRKRKHSMVLESYLDLSILPPFTRKVLFMLQKIPFGEGISYHSLANLVGNPKAARAVGNACGRNPYPLVIPCHRVLAANNRIGGFSMGLETKKQLVAFEDITLA